MKSRGVTYLRVVYGVYSLTLKIEKNYLLEGIEDELRKNRIKDEENL